MSIWAASSDIDVASVAAQEAIESIGGRVKGASKMSDIDLRSYVFLILQPQHAAFIGTVAGASSPCEAKLRSTEIAPGIAINRLTDVAVKATDAQPGMQIVSASTASLSCITLSRARFVAQVTLSWRSWGSRKRSGSSLGCQLHGDSTPRRPAAQLINHTARSHDRRGVPLGAGVSSSGERRARGERAEKAANIKILEVRSFGSSGASSSVVTTATSTSLCPPPRLRSPALKARKQVVAHRASRDECLSYEI